MMVTSQFLKLFTITFCILIGISCYSNAQEVVVEEVNLPGASLSSEVYYSTTKAEYEAEFTKKLRLLKAGKIDGFFNPEEGPYRIVQTTAKIGFSVKGFGKLSGKSHLRQVSSADEALFQFEKWCNAITEPPKHCVS